MMKELVEPWVDELKFQIEDVFCGVFLVVSGELQVVISSWAQDYRCSISTDPAHVTFLNLRLYLKQKKMYNTI